MASGPQNAVQGGAQTYQANPQQVAMAMQLMQQQQSAGGGGGGGGFVDPAIMSASGMPAAPVAASFQTPPIMGPRPQQGDGETMGLMRMLQRANIDVNSTGALPVPPRTGMPIGTGAVGGMPGMGMHTPPPITYQPMMLPSAGATAMVDPVIVTSGGPVAGGATRGRGNARAAARAAYASGARGGRGVAPVMGGMGGGGASGAAPSAGPQGVGQPGRGSRGARGGGRGGRGVRGGGGGGDQ